LHDRANGFAANLKQAGDSDARIERTIRDNMPLMSILDAKPIESALPTLGRPMLSLDGNEDQIVGALRQRLAELEQCASQRAGLEDMLKDMKRKDNILPKLMTTSGSYEDLFKKELGKYDLVSQEVARNIENQERLFRQIKMHNDAFAATFNLEDFKNQKEKAFNQVRAAVAKYREIRENINEGLKFYVTLQDAITNLKQQCSDYVMTRSIQCREMMDDLQRQIAGLSFTNDNRQSRTYPSVGASAPVAPSPSPGSQDSSYYNATPAPSYGAQSPARPPYYAGQNQPGMPAPPYYSQPPVQPASPSHAPSHQHSHNFSQPPYPGWQGPYYNGPPVPPAPQASPPPQPGAATQPPYHASPSGGFFSSFYK
jgi:programmed cell death 6-interacting protein